MANTLKIKRGTAATIPQGQLAEPLFTTDTYDLYIGKGSGGNQRIQNYIASGTSSQFLKGDGTLDSTSYQPLITAGTTSQYYRGDKTFQTLDTSVVPENGPIYFTEPRVRATVLTGLNLSGGGTIAATDSILTAFGKVQNQISALVGGATYQGTWNANTNTPTLASGTGTKGYYYVVSVAGSTNLDGITDWKIGDWAIFNGTTWDKVDNTDAVSSVNGFTGAVNLALDNISDVSAASPTNAQLLRFNGTSSLWENWTPTFEPALTKGNLTETTSSVLTITGGTGAVIGSGTTIAVASAGAAQAGVVTTGTQTFAGVKTFSSTPVVPALHLADMTAGTGALYYNTAAKRLTLANYNADGILVFEVNGGAFAMQLNADLTARLNGYTTNGILKVGSSNGTIGVAVAADFPTLNQNTTGSAATLTTARNFTINGTAKSFDGSANVSWTAAEIGLTSYLPLTGGTLTGALSGTSATFSSSVSLYSSTLSFASSLYPLQLGARNSIYSDSSGNLLVNNNVYYNGTSNVYAVNGIAQRIYFDSAGGMNFQMASSGTAGNAVTFTTPLAISSTGAATFSSSVTANQFISNATNVGDEYYFIKGNAAVNNNFSIYAYSNYVYFNAYNSINIRANNTGGSGGSINLTGGNVGIGTTSPSEQLNLQGANAYTSKIRFTYGASATGYYANFGYNSDGNKVYLQIADGAAASNIMTWNYTGNVGIGTTSPTLGKLQVEGSGGDTLISVNNTTNNGAGLYMTVYNSGVLGSAGQILQDNGGNMRFYTGTSLSERMRITSGGNVGIGVTSLVSPGGSRNLLQISNGTNGAQIALGSSTSESNNPRIFSTQHDLGFAAHKASGKIEFYTDDTVRLTIAQAGAATFSSSLTANELKLTGAAAIQNTTTGGYLALYGNTGGLYLGAFNAGANQNYMYISGSGNVGIGTTSPNRLLDVNGVIRTQNAGSAGAPSIELGTSAQGNGLFYPTTNTIAIATNDTERMRITSGGYLKLREATSSTTSVHILRADTTSDAVVQVNNSNASNASDGMLAVVATRNTTNNTFYALGYYNSGAGAWRFRVSDGGNIEATGTLKTGTTSTGNASAFKIGNRIVNTCTVSTSAYLEIEVAGTLYYLAFANPS